MYDWYFIRLLRSRKLDLKYIVHPKSFFAGSSTEKDKVKSIHSKQEFNDDTVLEGFGDWS
jgi:hypothetical protein